MNLRTLIIEDNPADAELIQRLLKKAFGQVDSIVVANASELIKQIEQFQPDIFISDNSLPRFSAAEALELVKEHAPHIPFILVTGTVSEEFAAEMIKSGADDYILKDRMARLPAAMEAAMLKRKAQREKEAYVHLLQQSQENLKTIFENTSEGFVLLDADLRVKKFNSRAGELLRLYIQKEMEVGQSILELTEESRRDSFAAVLHRVKEGEFVEYDRSVPAPSREDGWMHFFFNPVIQDNTVTGICITARDVTVSKRAALQLQQSAEENRALAGRVSAILNTLPANIALLDEHGLIIDVNECWKKFAEQNGFRGIDYGVGENYLAVSEKAGIADPESETGAIAHGIAGVLNGSLQQFITEYACDSLQEKRWFRMIVTPLSEQLYRGAVVMHIDISEIKRLDQERLDQKMNEQKRIGRAMLKAQEKERTAIGIELHDNVNQILVGTNLLLSHAKARPADISDLLTQSISNIQQAIRENRKIAHEFVAPDLETERLTDQLQMLFENMLRAAGIRVIIEKRGLDETLLDSDRKFNIYRIAQEQCTNILKYADATVVTIKLSSGESVFRMSIADNGKGMNTGQTAKGIGLKNIRHRAALFSGSVEIRTGLGEGFELRIEVPLVG
ncbi:MAG: response regulator [Chitinophagaceae bacterium]